MAKKSKIQEKQVETSLDVKLAKDTVDEFFKLLGVKGTIDVTQTEEGIEILLDTEESGIVIGRHGEMLEALQHILSFILSKKVNQFVRVSVEVGEYKKNRIDYLRNLALQTKEKAIQDKREYSLPNLKSWERRIVHMFLQDDGEVISESVGEGRDRTLTIKPK